ncbi:hypothetical protein BLNAU_17518 [Blattamonas nauphoetae]|uniref:Protein kinase domain-containing protein n=1 Tax=Blattamonas nauphoetae TaxID=2049346 RepID=A0ABQ9X6Z5_9EUKA|nr:hypothetical protein BLNAU_17518 [Blattamonas nauphoetae]
MELGRCAGKRFESNKISGDRFQSVRTDLEMIKPYFASSSFNLMNLPVLILVHLLCAEAKFRERRILPLSLQMTFAPDAETAHISGNKQAFMPEINLNHGTPLTSHKHRPGCVIIIGELFRPLTVRRASRVWKWSVGWILVVDRTRHGISSNHLYGTACIDMNLGGSLLCSNTSFSHCNLEYFKPQESEVYGFILQHKTGPRDPISISKYTNSDLIVRRCTFFSITGESRGGGLRLHNAPADITMSECSFSKCSVGTGGAIHIEQMVEGYRLSISSSLFVDCAVTSYGGAIDVSSGTSITIADVFMRNNTAGNSGGSLFVEWTSELVLSNCVIETCAAAGTYSQAGGGGIHLYEVSSTKMDSVLFRKCSAKQGNDMFINRSGSTQELRNNITNCYSTSDRPNVYMGSSKDSTLIPELPSNAPAASLVEIENKISEDQKSSNLTVKVDTILNGKMLVWLDNTNSYIRPNVDCRYPYVNSPPAIGRLLIFKFSSSTESEPLEVEFGEWGELQFESNYTVVDTLIANKRLAPSSIVLTTPNPPRIVQILFSEGSGTDHLWLQLKGRYLQQGTYSVQLRWDRWITVEFDGSKDETTQNMFSSLHSELIFGTESKLKLGYTYDITYITFEDTSERVILDPRALFIKTPSYPPRLTSVGPVSFKDNLTKDTILIPLVGASLSSKSHTLTLISSSSPSEPVSLPVTFSDGETSTIEVVVYSKDASDTKLRSANEIQLKYGEIYTVEELITGTTKCLFETAFSITVPDEPKRIEKGRVTLNEGKDEATLRLKGRALTGGSYKLKLDSVDSVRTSETSLSDDGELLFKVPISTSPTSILTFGATYTISSLKIEDESVVVNSDVALTVPSLPLVETAQVHPNSINTSMRLGLTGTSLKLDGFYTVTLSPPFSLDMLFNSSETISSHRLVLGRSGSLQHNTAYTIVSITRVGNDSDVIETEGTVSFTTPKFPVPLVLHVNEKEGEDDELCGESDDACATIDFAWSIVVALNAKTATLAIVNSSEQTQPIVVSSGMSILFRNGGNLEPTLTIPSSASLGDKSGMVVVDNAGFEVDDVTIGIESSDPSFVFLSASESTIILKEGTFVGGLPSTLTSNSDHENVCSWESGIVRLDNSVTTLNRMTLSSLLQGVIHMKNGSINLEGVIIHNNSPNLASFPSARRNIRCVDGSVTIGSLSGGDGSKDSPSAWISTTDCTVSGDGARPSSPLFVPTLSSESNSTWIQKEKRFSVLIVGTSMIPCGLSLEVFEMKKDKSEGESERVELSFETTDSFNDTHITLSVALTSLSSLNDALEWRGRLVFGLNETTSEWFVVQKSSADRKAESLLEHMKWWLPLVIVLLCCALVVIIVIVVILRRRRKQKDSEAQHESGQEMDSDKIEVEELDETEVRTSVNGLKGGSLDPEIGDASTVIHATQLDGQLSDCVSVLDCGMLEAKEMSKMETLFERLHKNKTRIVGKRQRQIELARGLEKIGKTNGNAPILRKLTSHWILIGADGHFNLKLKEEGETGRDHHSQTQTQTGGSIVGEEGGSVDVHKENANGMDRAAKEVREKEDQEGQRWQAPEQGGMDGMESCDVEKVTVFRLGLVLWEMETGQIPFRETDGVNAGRQLKSGVKPHMDLVGNKEMEELLLKCLELKATDRIGLDEVISSLDSIPDDPVPTQQLFNS